MEIKHTILIITYNHEKTIAKAIDSIVLKKILPFEIFIFDDCSQDNTSKVIEAYIQKYSFIKYIRNEENLGIYENLNNMYKTRISGNIVSFLSGDDYIEGDMLSSFNKVIQENNLNGKEESFLITPNTKIIECKTKKENILNNYILRNKNQFKLKVKLKTYGRFTGISRKLFESFEKNDSSYGIWADQLHAVDVYHKCDKFYFVDIAHNVYSRNEGSVSVRTDAKEMSRSLERVNKEILKKYRNDLNILDKIYLKKMIYASKFNYEKNYKNFILFIVFNFLSFGQDNFKTWAKSFASILPENLKKILKGKNK